MWGMSILQRLRADLQRRVAEHQAMLLTQVLQQRFAELTLGDLRELLTSSLGRGLDQLKLADLAGSAGKGASTPATRGKRAAVAAPRQRERVRKASAVASPGRRPVRHPSATSGAYAASIVDALRAAGEPMTSGELRAKLGGSPSTMYRAVTELIKAGRVESEGKPARYSLTSSAGEGATGEATAGAPAPARRVGPQEVSARTVAGKAEYDAAVLNLLQQTSGWIGASQLRASVGGSDNQMRIALHRLLAAGQVVRRGERNSTEYRVSPRA